MARTLISAWTPDPQDNCIDITDGTIIQRRGVFFHSLTQFGLNQNELGNFLSHPAIQNILLRVRGDNG
ncbi:MAG: hypothetical protein AB1861_20940 [Cyanobacteriota bacterium]